MATSSGSSSSSNSSNTLCCYGGSPCHAVVDHSLCGAVMCCGVCGVQGGNDYEIFSSEKTIGHTVTSPDDTQKQCTELFMKQ